jgi:hypothetical protein
VKPEVRDGGGTGHSNQRPSEQPPPARSNRQIPDKCVEVQSIHDSVHLLPFRGRPQELAMALTIGVLALFGCDG